MLDNFYDEVQKISEATDDLSETAKAVVLFRVATESSAREVGWESAVYLMSRLMTVTLGVMAGDEEESFEKILADLDLGDMTSH
jgi:hypothetical protein|tara:strand:- start:124 stop:375 length:252 start_codon:yes stop_codon:yes gene_type:complete